MAVKVGMPKLKEARVYDLNREAAEKFCQEMSAELGIDAHPVNSLEEAVRDCDAVSTATSGPVKPKFEPEWFKPGAFFGLSSDAEMGAEMWLNGRIVADNWKMHLAWRHEVRSNNPNAKMPIHGELHDLIAAGRLSDGDVVEMGDVVAGRVPGRVDDNQIVIMATGGLGMEDVSWGFNVYKRAKEMGLGTPLKLWDKPHWF